MDGPSRRLRSLDADCLLHGFDYAAKYREYFRAYPDAGYGLRFFQWASSGNKQPYDSWGNGSAMRVPPAIIAFLESRDYEDAIRKAISLGGDADTLACITGSIAEPFYRGVPAAIARQTFDLLDEAVAIP